MEPKKDYYEVLGVDHDADARTIKRAFLKLARKLHPDVSDAPDAEERFKEVSEAYAVLSDDEKRRRYDAMRSGAPFAGGYSGQAPRGGYGDPFAGGPYAWGPFGASTRRQSRAYRPRQGADVVIDVTVGAEKAATGMRRGVTYQRYAACDHCHGTGSVEAEHSETCPTCGGKLQYRGFGTQKAEEELAKLFPEARVLRMDQDSTMQKNAHEKMLARFAKQEYDILLGTQMVAKGLDFGNVTLVGVLGIDSLLFGQGFRSYENVFSLITQVVGRGGRAELPGRALIQTAVPDHPVLQLAAAQDYPAFYQQEIMFRKFSLYPPFCSFCVVSFSGAQEMEVFQAARRFAAILGQQFAAHPGQPLRVLGPTPMNIAMISGKYRYKLTLKCRNDAGFRTLMHAALDAYAAEKLPAKAGIALDFNSEGD